VVLQDIGESEASELVGLYRPLVGKAVQELLGDVDLSSQGSLEGLDLRDLVRPRTAEGPGGQGSLSAASSAAAGAAPDNIWMWALVNIG
jgi:hypothetical protein